MRRRVLIFGLLSLVCALAVVIGAEAGRRAGSQSLAPGAIAQVGGAAPDFTLKTPSGAAVSLSDLRGRPTVLNFFASWCTDCRLEAPAMNALYRRVRGQVAFYGIDATEVDSAAGAASFARQYHLAYPYLLDTTGDVTQAYGVIGLPVTFFLNADGKIVRRIVGAVPLSAGLAGIRAAEGS